MKQHAFKGSNFMRFWVVAFLLILPTIAFPRMVLAAGCNGDTCHGLNPNTMGCSATTYTSKKLYNSNNIQIGLVENRQSPSNSCYAQWERTTNKTGTSAYAEGSIRWGGTNYSPGIQPVTSGGKILNNETVYTPMHGNSAGVGPSLNCGQVATTAKVSPPAQPLTIPHGSYYLNNCVAR